MKAKHLLQCHLLLAGISPGMTAAVPRLPGLEGLLAVAGGRREFAGGAASWLCRACGIARQHDWPVAPFAALGEGLAPGAQYWLRADPVHLHLLRDSLSVADCAPLDLTMAEAAPLLATLNRHFAADGIQLLAPDPNRWYLRLTVPPALATRPLAEAVGQDVERWLPQGADAMQWHGWINEAQMLLHDHPVNLEREQRGLWPVNSIWPWGGGVLPPPAGLPFQGVWTQDALARGLALASGGEAHALPDSAAAWRSAAADGAHLIVLDVLDRAELRQDAARWQETLQRLDRQWFAPLLENLKSGRIAGIHLHLADFSQVWSYAVQRTDLWKFWRRPQPLESFLHG